ncbi:MAG: hypothetical protein ACD_15C00230G0001 [uncultured bacterium]|nr:MAG: hypothetical protein ACD_15C00230G0001 [uncultured bacterium]
MPCSRNICFKNNAIGILKIYRIITHSKLVDIRTCIRQYIPEPAVFGKTARDIGRIDIDIKSCVHRSIGFRNHKQMIHGVGSDCP